MNRKNYKDGVEWEEKVAYSRAVKIYNFIEVSGTVAVRKDGSIPEDAGEQARLTFDKIEKALKHLGAGRENVIRTRIYVKDISEWEKIGLAHGEFFRGIDPASSMLEVSRFISEEYKVEIEASAIL